MSGGSGTGTPATSPSIARTVASWHTGAPFVFERVTLPDIEPVTLAEMKVHLRGFTSVSDDDAQVTKLIVGAREWVEDYTGRALIDQTWRLTMNKTGYLGGDAVKGFTPAFVGLGRREWIHWMRRGEIRLLKSPVLAITSFVSADFTGAETAIPVTDYALCEPDSKWPRIAALSGATWTTGALKVEFRAGFADRLGSPQQGAEMVPERFKQAMKLWVEANYDRDKDMMPLLLKTAEGLLKPERADLQIA